MGAQRLIRQFRGCAYRKLRHAKPAEWTVKLMFVLCCMIITLVMIIHRYENLGNFKRSLYYRYAVPSEPFFDRPRNVDGGKVDWHDYERIEEETNRVGPGEHGKPLKLSKAEDRALNDRLYKENGYAAVVSDHIALNRSVPDIRHPNCRTKQYLRELPSVSVIIIFYNEHWSTLLRTVYSVLDRSPPDLLKEIVLVNDHSTKEFLWDPLRDFVDTQLPKKVKLIHLKERSGLILARMAGARAASGDVLIVLDSHSEVNTNWLPPLLEPIAEDYRTCVCPLIDVIAHDTFEYRSQDEGKRGGFDWKFYYKRLPLLPGDLEDPTEPFNNPIMAGGLFAISAKFFWELEGYDEGLDIWGGEQYELSFKIWQCGGRMVDAPCSRVGHVYRGYAPFGNPRGVNFVTRNFKRVAEVWMDDYKNFLYDRNPQFAKTDAGDLTKQKALRERLHCKSFQWFLDVVAPDLLVRYPVREPEPFATGRIQSIATPKLCLDTLNHRAKEPIGLFSCATNATHPQNNQFFTLTYYRDIRARSNDKCLDAAKMGDQIVLFSCHESQGNQMWRYDYASKLIYHGKDYLNQCLDMNPTSKKIFLASCDTQKPTQKWEWGSVNHGHLQNWDVYGAKFL